MLNLRDRYFSRFSGRIGFDGSARCKNGERGGESVVSVKSDMLGELGGIAVLDELIPASFHDRFNLIDRVLLKQQRG